MTVTQVSSEDVFDELLEKGRPLLVAFTAIWSAPAKELMPVVDEVAEELGDAVDVIVIDVDDASWEDDRLEVNSVPALLLFRGGKELLRMSGVKPKEDLLMRIAEALAV
jgi:thioredoxin 1